MAWPYCRASAANQRAVMSKQSEAKAAQEYSSKAPSCKSCVNYMFELERKPAAFSYTQPYNVEKNRRCKRGGFAVSPLGHCPLWRSVDGPAPVVCF